MRNKIKKILAKAKIKVLAGAVNFFHFVKGKDPKAMFKKLTQDARRQQGSRSYTGTIAEKDSFTLSSKGPVTLKEAQKIANKDNSDKYGPAIAIAVVASGKPKQKPFKKNIKAFTKDEAIEMAEKELDSKIKSKGFDWDWIKRDVETLKPRKANFKKIKTEEGIKLEAFKDYDGASEVAKKSEEVENKMQKLVEKLPGAEKIVVKTIKKEIYDVKYFKAPALFKVSGVIEYSKSKKNIIGYAFYGWAAE